jgi:NAD-dependent SIR2 family protein deacetylase
MQNKTIVITGAGFSAPANIPIQNKILDEMITQENNILDTPKSNIELDNEKFLDAFVRVGLYLLTNYCDITEDIIFTEFAGISNNDLSKRYSTARKSSERIDFFNELIEKSSIPDEDENRNREKIIIQKFLLEHGPSFDEYFTEMIYIKGEIKRRLAHSEINVSLEDIFTAFDKAISLKMHTRNFTYHEEDAVKQSILRLFIYYFGKRLLAHDYKSRDYLRFIEFIKRSEGSCSIITTNWDTLIEGYFVKGSIAYDLCLNSIYYKYDDSRKNSKRKKEPALKLIKLHGSINWFRYLQCGYMSIIEKRPCGEYLFSVDKEEICINCGEKARNDSVLLQPEIITPTMIKSFDNQLYKNLWASAAEELRSAERIIFIGYSMPTADYELKYLLQNNISSACKIDVVLYRNDDPKQLTKKQKHIEYLLPEKRYTDAFIKNNINFFYEGFGEYFNIDGNGQTTINRV